MSISFAISERPQSLAELCGNKRLKEQLAVSFRTNTLPNCILFTGDAGSGKTTCAGIVRNMLNVQEMNYHKFDFANDSGVDNMRSFVEAVKVPPFGADQKSFFELAELHAVNTKKGQDVLLETLENLPENVYVVATTNQLDRIQKTVRDRFTIYRLSLPTEEELLYELIVPCCKKYKFKLKKETASEIISISGRVPRLVMNMLYSIHKLPIEEHLLYLQQQCSSEGSDLFKVYLYLKQTSNTTFNDYKRFMSMLDKIEGDWESKRCGLIKMFERDLKNPYNEKDLSLAVDFFEAFRTPCFTMPLSQFAANLYKFIFRAHENLRIE